MNSIIYNGWVRPVYKAPVGVIVSVLVTEEANGHVVWYGHADIDNSIEYSQASTAAEDNGPFFHGTRSRERALERAVELKTRAFNRYEQEMAEKEVAS